MCSLYVLRAYIPSVKFFWKTVDTRQSLKLSSFREIILNDRLFVPREKDVCSRLEFEPINLLIEQADPFTFVFLSFRIVIFNS